MKLVTVVLFAFVGNVYSWGGYKVNFEHNDLEFDESLMSMDVKMKRADDKTVVNIRNELFEDINTPIIVHAQHYERVNTEYQHLFNVSMNVCNILSRVKSHPILRIIMKELLKNSNFPTGCPIKKGIYYMKDFSLNEDLLPPFLPIGHFKSQATFTRLIDDTEVPMLKITVKTDIDYEKERRNLKLF